MTPWEGLDERGPSGSPYRDWGLEVLHETSLRLKDEHEERMDELERIRDECLDLPKWFQKLDKLVERWLGPNHGKIQRQLARERRRREREQRRLARERM
jgi:hypothetical protein